MAFSPLSTRTTVTKETKTVWEIDEDLLKRILVEKLELDSLPGSYDIQFDTTSYGDFNKVIITHTHIEEEVS